MLELGREFSGYCPICEAATVFVTYAPTYRDHLICTRCPGFSIPRQRALMDVLQRELPEWRSVDIHESSPSDGALQARLSEARYVATQYHPDAARGEVVAGYRNENLEAQTFGDESFDVVLTLDVLEHVNRPERVFAEVARTLRPSGRFIFTVPTYPSLQYTARVGEYDSDGRIHFLGEPEFHDNPVDPAGAAVTFRYGYDLPALIFDWTGMETTVTRGQRLSIGVFGDMTEVYVSHKVDAC